MNDKNDRFLSLRAASVPNVLHVNVVRVDCIVGSRFLSRYEHNRWYGFPLSI